MPTRPRILILTAYYFPFQGGVETHARTLATYLAQHDFQVAVVTRRVEGPPPANERVDGVRVHRVGLGGPRTGLRKWLMIPFATIQILRLRGTFDLIYCPGYQGIGMAALLCGRLLGRPVILRSGNLGVLSGHNWDAPLARWHIDPASPPVGWLKRLVRRVYLTADALVCNCRDIQDEALGCQMPADRVHYLPNGVDLDKYHPPTHEEKAGIRAEAGWPQGPVCVYLGRLSQEKGVLNLLEAWRMMPERQKLLVLIGPDMTGHPLDAGPAARRYVREHAMEDSVHFHGESLAPARLLRGADLYTQPSHYEAFSNAVIEAMATGLPVVASRVGGMLDCITDDVNGLFCAPADSADLARQLSRLLEDADLRVRLGTQARETVVVSFDREIIFKQFADLFGAVSARRR